MVAWPGHCTAAEVRPHTVPAAVQGKVKQSNFIELCAMVEILKQQS